MRYRVVSSVVVAALVVAGCGGGDDEISLDDLEASIEDEASTENGASTENEALIENDDASDASSDGDGEATGEGPGFGEFESGQIALTGAEEITYAVDDPALGFVSGGGCGGENYGLSVNVQDASAKVTEAQISANIDEDMSGGRTGTFPVDEISLIVIPDGDMTSSRTYEGPGTLDVIEHDNAAPDFVLNERRTVLSITGTLDASGADEAGSVELDADLVWVMGCP